jgi:hypothetical protein
MNATLTALETDLLGRGFTSDQVATVTELVNHREFSDVPNIDDITARRAAELIRVIFLRVERDSPAGCALRRALGFSGGVSFARAAADFGVSKQHLHNLQEQIEAQLGHELTFLAKQRRAAEAAVTSGAAQQVQEENHDSTE